MRKYEEYEEGRTSVWGLVGEAVNVIEVTILVKVDEQLRLLSRTSS